MKYVIERSEPDREWYCGNDQWSDVETDVLWLETRLEAEIIAARVGGKVTGFEVD